MSELSEDCFLLVEDLKPDKSESKIRKSMELKAEEEEDDDDEDDDEGDENEEQTEEQVKVLAQLHQEIRDSMTQEVQ